MRHDLNINLKLSFPLSFMSMLFFPSAIWMFFYVQHLSFAEIATIMGIGAVFSLILEVPTGVFADLVGRRWAVFWSYVLYSVAMVGIAWSTSFADFLVWTLVNATVNALYSGSMEALLYDTLKSQGRENEFDGYTSRMESATWWGLFVSTVIGGYAYAIQPTLPYYMQAVIAAIAAGLSLKLVEPWVDSQKYDWRQIVSKNIEGVRELCATPIRRYYTALFVVIGVGYYVAADLLGISQAREYGLEPEMVGWVFGIGYVISALASHYYPLTRRLVGEIKLVWVAAGVLVLSFVLAKYVGVLIGVILIIGRIASSTTFRNSRSVIINREISSRNRATSLSTLNLLTMLPYALLARIAGDYVDRRGANELAWLLGIVIIGTLGIIEAYRRRVWTSFKS